jgi:hypothetical protein
MTWLQKRGVALIHYIPVTLLRKMADSFHGVRFFCKICLLFGHYSHELLFLIIIATSVYLYNGTSQVSS